MNAAMMSNVEAALSRSSATVDAVALLARYRQFVSETRRVRAQLDESTRMEARLLMALRRSGVTYHRLARAVASALALETGGHELRRLTQRLRQQRRRRAARERESLQAAANTTQASEADHAPEVSARRTGRGKRRLSPP
jgi:hypothetical protein